MRILQLRFKNLNSLYGQWKIDFENPNYVANSIYAIVGPTGSGKSTILDAICLALYGATPRLNKIASENEIMSRQTSDCFSEVTFESQGNIYRCFWSQHRAYKKKDGKLASSRHELSDALTGNVIESQKTAVLEAIIEKTGMDFGRFTRSILLPQGNFDNFLKAEPELKSKILEQITGTDKYTEISRQVHIKNKEEIDKLKLLKAQLDLTNLLSDEDVQNLRDQLDINKQRDSQNDKQLQQTDKELLWLQQITELKNELLNLNDQRVALDKQIVAFEPDRQRLKNAKKAMEPESEYTTLVSEEKQLNEEQKNLSDLQSNLKDAKASLDILKPKLADVQQEVKTLKKEHKSTTETAQKARLMDQQIADKQKQISTHEKELSALDKQLKNNDKDQKTNISKLEQTKKELKTQLDYLKTNANDEQLVSKLEVIKEKFSLLEQLKTSIDSEEKKLVSKQKRLQEISEELSKIEPNKKILLEKREKAELLISNSENLLKNYDLTELQKEKENLIIEAALIQNIANYDTERKKLQSNQPCPLCGSLQHPFVDANPLEDSDNKKKLAAIEETIESVKKLEANQKKAETQLVELQRKINFAENAEALLKNEDAIIQKALKEIEEQIEKLKLQLITDENILLQELKPFKIDQLPKNATDKVIQTLSERLNEWSKVSQKIQLSEKRIIQLETELTNLRQNETNLANAINEKNMSLNDFKAQMNELLKIRQELFADKDPDYEINAITLKLETAEKTSNITQTEVTRTEQIIDSTNKQIEQLKMKIIAKSESIEKLKTDFLALLKQHGFESKETYLAAKLPTLERNELQEKAETLDSQKIDIETRIKDRNTNLTKKQNENLTDASIEELQAKLVLIKEERGLLKNHIADLTAKLTTYEETKKILANLRLEIERQNTICNRWRELDELIGSADGKKYRNFVQGLTFKTLVANANKQLQKMNNRYFLVDIKDKPLELMVQDNYQAGEIRSVKNLSGGESFIVSLALALGLSKMASSKVKVDSLFLDEGFGTLDSDALELALDSLSSLQHEGKTIGIISHVDKLKDRIATQISLQHTTGGRSVMSGPGCSQEKEL